jgi:hypothetical protein
MLVARRDSFHSDAHDAAASQGANGAGRTAPKLARTVNMLQVVGSLLAIPVGLASGYSIYRANFSVDTTCQTLRANIVSMIDKSVDAGTRRMLVRRDVEKFEQSCGAIDPDATAAFKELLAADKAPGPAAAIAAPAPQRAEAQPKPAVRKIETRPQVAGKAPAEAWPTTATLTVRHDPEVSDAQWVDAVRQALVTHHEERPRADAATAPVAPAAVPAPPHAKQEAALPTPAPIPAPVVAAPVSAPIAAPVAPALPPAATIATPGVAKADPDHPVPPGAIPDPADAATAKPDEHHSRIGRWIARVLLLGPMWENGQQ